MAKKKVSKTIDDINQRIREGKVVVVTADEMAGAKALAAWKEKIRAGWSKVKVNEIEVDRL